MGSLGASWGLLEPPGGSRVSWGLLGPPGIFGALLGSPDGSWGLLGSPGVPVCVGHALFYLFSCVFLQVSNDTAEVTEVGFAGFVVFLHVLIAFRVERAQVFAYSCSGVAVFIEFVHRLRTFFLESDFCLWKSKVFRVRLKDLCLKHT